MQRELFAFLWLLLEQMQEPQSLDLKFKQRSKEGPEKVNDGRLCFRGFSLCWCLSKWGFWFAVWANQEQEGSFVFLFFYCHKTECGLQKKSIKQRRLEQERGRFTPGTDRYNICMYGKRRVDDSSVEEKFWFCRKCNEAFTKDQLKNTNDCNMINDKGKTKPCATRRYAVQSNPCTIFSVTY